MPDDLKVFRLTLTADQLSVIDEGLQEVVLKRAGPVVAAINAQIQAQREEHMQRQQRIAKQTGQP